MSPIPPMPIDLPDEDTGRPTPRRWQYPIGYNLPTTMPGGGKLASFEQLRAYGDLYSVVRACVNIRRDEMAGMDWDVGPTADAQTATKGDKGAGEDMKNRANQIKAWFKRIDSNYYGFQSWFTSALEEQLIIDAVSLYLAPTRVAGKGLFGSDLSELQLLSGSTIRPLLDMSGATPRPPCYSADTEILSHRGWVRFTDLSSNDEVATRSKDGRFEWQRPTAYTDQSYSGLMVDFHSQVCDIRVTPQHRMLTRGRDDDDWRFREASEFVGLTGEDWQFLSEEGACQSPEGHYVEYDGHVYCVTVPNGVVYVRRNGHPIWSGNSPAYQQYLWGVPRSELQAIMTDADLDMMKQDLQSAGVDDDIEPNQEYRADQLLYIPRIRRTWTNYGFSAIEQALVPITLGMQRQNYLLDFYREGTVPSVYVIAGDQYVTPAQQRQLQDNLNAIAGDVAWKHRVIVLPPGSKTDPQKNMDGQYQMDSMVAEQVAMILHIQPHEIGMIPGGRSSSLGGGGKGQAEQQAASATESRTEPDAKWWKEVCFDWIIQRVFKQTDLEWKWLDFEEAEDDATRAQTDQAYISMGESSIDEIRIESGKDPWNFPLTKAPFLMVPGQGIVPLDPTVPPPPPPPAPAPTTPAGMPGGVQPGHPAVAALSNALQPELGKNPDKPKNDPASALLSDKKKDRKKGRAELTDRFADNLKDLTKKPPEDGQPTPQSAQAQQQSPIQTPAQSQTSAPNPPQGAAVGNETEAKPGEATQTPPAPATATQPSGTPASGATAPPAAQPPSKKLTVADLVKGKKSDLSQDEFVQIVQADLSHQYPPKLTAWVPKLTWRYDDGVKVKDMTGQPGSGKDPEIVNAIGLSIQAGAPIDPLVLVEFPDELAVANGNKRLAAAQEQDVKKLPAYIGTVAAADTDTVRTDIKEMQDPQYQENVKKAALAELATFRRFLRKGGDATKFVTKAIDTDTHHYLMADLATMDREAALDKARDRVTKQKGDPSGLINWYNSGADGQIQWSEPGDFDQCVDVASNYMSDSDAKGFCNLRHQDAVGGPPGSEDKVADKSISTVEPLESGVVPFDLSGESVPQRCPKCDLLLAEDGTCPVHGTAVVKRQQADDLLAAVEAELLKRGVNPFEPLLTKDIEHAPAGSPDGGQFVSSTTGPGTSDAKPAVTAKPAAAPVAAQPAAPATQPTTTPVVTAGTTSLTPAKPAATVTQGTTSLKPTVTTAAPTKPLTAKQQAAAAKKAAAKAVRAAATAAKKAERAAVAAAKKAERQAVAAAKKAAKEQAKAVAAAAKAKAKAAAAAAKEQAKALAAKEKEKPPKTAAKPKKPRGTDARLLASSRKVSDPSEV